MGRVFFPRYENIFFIKLFFLKINDRVYIQTIPFIAVKRFTNGLPKFLLG